MDYLASDTGEQFKSLIDLVAADHVGLFLTPSALSDLGPCLANDNKSPIITELGPAIGDD
jgi:hypothetical protein